jgi:hypothetical protein
MNAGRETLPRRRGHRNLVFLILAGGAALRILQYGRARSLWLDEAMLANNVIDLPLARLMPPHLFKVAPFGFLAVEKLIIGALGSSELAFRLIPLLAALGSLLLLHVASRELLGEQERLLALACFALSPPLIFYASEAKSYSSDVFVVLAITTAVMSYLKAPSGRSLLALGVGGAMAVWVSYPAIFVLATVGPVVLWHHRSQARPLWPVVAAGASWLASFLGCYQLTMRKFASHEALLSYWSQWFAPFPPHGWSDLAWYGNRLLALFEHPLGLERPFVGLAAFLSIAGVVRLWRRNRTAAVLLLGPLFATLVASTRELYPVEGRVVLFWCPALVLLVASGAGSAPDGSARSWTVLLAAALLLLAPAQTARGLLQGRTIHVEPAEEMRPLLEEMVPQVQAGDSVYVYYGARSAVAYYARRMDWNHPLHLGASHRLEPERYRQDVDQLRGARLWLIFSHVHTGPRGDERRLILNHLRRERRPITKILKPGASAYLFDLR